MTLSYEKDLRKIRVRSRLKETSRVMTIKRLFQNQVRLSQKWACNRTIFPSNSLFWQTWWHLSHVRYRNMQTYTKSVESKKKKTTQRSQLSIKCIIESRQVRWVAIYFGQFRELCNQNCVLPGTIPSTVHRLWKTLRHILKNLCQYHPSWKKYLTHPFNSSSGTFYPSSD